MPKQWILGLMVALTTLLSVGVVIFLSKTWLKKESYAARIPVEHIQNASSSTTLRYYYEAVPNDPWGEQPSWLDYRAEYQSNSVGFNDEDYQLEKTTGVYRILTLGDSHTFGQYVSTRDNYPEQLERLFAHTCPERAVEVINAGYMGDDIQYAVERYLNKGRQFDPDLIVWWLKNDDIYTIEESYRAESNAVAEEFGLVDLASLSDSELKKYTATHSARVVDRYLKKYPLADILIKQKEYIARLLSVYSHTVLIIHYSDEDAVYIDFLHSLAEQYPDKVTLFPFAATSDIQRLPDWHPTAQGYSLVSNRVFNFLRPQICLPPASSH